MAAVSTPRSAAILAAAGEGGMAALRRRRRSGGFRGRARRGAGLGAASLTIAASRRGAGFGDLAEQGADADGLAVLGGDFRQHAGGGRVDFERHLVGFELDERLVGLDGVAGLFEPAADRRFGDGFAESWNADFNRHLGHAPPC